MFTAYKVNGKEQPDILVLWHGLMSVILLGFSNLGLMFASKLSDQPELNTNTHHICSVQGYLWLTSVQLVHLIKCERSSGQFSTNEGEMFSLKVPLYICNMLESVCSSLQIHHTLAGDAVQF